MNLGTRRPLAKYEPRVKCGRELGVCSLKQNLCVQTSTFAALTGRLIAPSTALPPCLPLAVPSSTRYALPSSTLPAPKVWAIVVQSSNLEVIWNCFIFRKVCWIAMLPCYLVTLSRKWLSYCS